MVVKRNKTKKADDRNCRYEQSLPDLYCFLFGSHLWEEGFTGTQWFIFKTFIPRKYVDSDVYLPKSA